MEMRILVGDASTADSLAMRLTAVLGAERVALDGESHEVDVHVEEKSDPAVIHALDAVVRWLDQARVGSAEIWLGANSYRIARWVPIETWQ
jgi:hypothetical protein